MSAMFTKEKHKSKRKKTPDKALPPRPPPKQNRLECKNTQNLLFVSKCNNIADIKWKAFWNLQSRTNVSSTLAFMFSHLCRAESALQ